MLGEKREKTDPPRDDYWGVGVGPQGLVKKNSGEQAKITLQMSLQEYISYIRKLPLTATRKIMFLYIGIILSCSQRLF